MVFKKVYSIFPFHHRCFGDLTIPDGKTACFYFFKEAIFDKASDGTYPRNDCKDSYFNIFENKDKPEEGFKVCNGQGKAFMVCSEPDDGVTGERTAHVNLVASNSAINWSEMFYLYIGLCKFRKIERTKRIVKYALLQMIPQGKLSSLFKTMKTIF